LRNRSYAYSGGSETESPATRVRGGNIALLIVDWSMRGTARNGSTVAVSGTATDAVHRGPDNRWLYVIDNPHGTGTPRLGAAVTDMRRKLSRWAETKAVADLDEWLSVHQLSV
jgi:hypothetical protein